jgi:hypothetical protein
MPAVERSARGEFVVAAESRLGIGDFDPDNDGWSQVARTNGAGQLGPIVAFGFDPSPPVVAIDHHHRCKTLQPARIDTVRAGQTRLFVTSTMTSLWAP